MLRLFRGRAFRCGWNPQWTLVHNGQPNLQTDDDDNDTSKQHQHRRRHEDDVTRGGGGARFSLLSRGRNDVIASRRLDATPFVLSLERVHMAPHLLFHAPEVTVSFMCVT